MKHYKIKHNSLCMKQNNKFFNLESNKVIIKGHFQFTLSQFSPIKWLKKLSFKGHSTTLQRKSYIQPHQINKKLIVFSLVYCKFLFSARTMINVILKIRDALQTNLRVIFNNFLNLFSLLFNNLSANI